MQVWGTIVNVRGFHTLKGLAEGYVRVKVRVQPLKPSLNPYPSEGLRVYSTLGLTALTLAGLTSLKSFKLASK